MLILPFWAFHNSQWTLQATLTCLLLYCFCGSLGQPLTRCVTVSSFVPHNLNFGESVYPSLLWLNCFLVPAPELQTTFPLSHSSKTPSLFTFLKTRVQYFWFSLQIVLVTYLHAKSYFLHPFSFFVNSSLVSPSLISLSFSASLSISSLLYFR